MSSMLSASAQKVQNVLKDCGVSCQVELPVSTRTAQEAADAIGCQSGQIAKSLVFKAKQSHKPILVIVSGANRVNEKKLKTLVGEKIKKADAEFVQEKTGFAIGGVPPVGHREPLETYIDEELLQYEEIWAAAGTPHAIFKLTPTELQKIVRGRVVSVK